MYYVNKILVVFLSIFISCSIVKRGLALVPNSAVISVEERGFQEDFPKEGRNTYFIQTKDHGWLYAEVGKDTPVDRTFKNFWLTELREDGEYEVELEGVIIESKKINSIYPCKQDS